MFGEAYSLVSLSYCHDSLLSKDLLTYKPYEVQISSCLLRSCLFKIIYHPHYKIRQTNIDEKILFDNTIFHMCWVVHSPRGLLHDLHNYLVCYIKSLIYSSKYACKTKYNSCMNKLNDQTSHTETGYFSIKLDACVSHESIVVFKNLNSRYIYKGCFQVSYLSKECFSTEIWFFSFEWTNV